MSCCKVCSFNQVTAIKLYTTAIWIRHCMYLLVVHQVPHLKAPGHFVCSTSTVSILLPFTYGMPRQIWIKHLVHLLYMYLYQTTIISIKILWYNYVLFFMPCNELSDTYTLLTNTPKIHCLQTYLPVLHTYFSFYDDAQSHMFWSIKWSLSHPPLRKNP